MNTLVTIFFTLMLFTNTATASLIDRGSGLIYDDILNITWQQNANLASTQTFGVSGIQVSGGMTWTTANSWISAMNASMYLGYNDWRLTNVDPVNGSSYNYTYSPDGTTDVGYNTQGVGHELAHLFYYDLGNPAYLNTSGNPQVPYGSSLVNVGIFNNLMSDIYITGTTYLDSSNAAWAFNTSLGNNPAVSKDNYHLAWAVRDGDSTPTGVPAPSSFFLVLLGGLCLTLSNKRIQN
jgi:hypothetical protein